MPHLQGYDMHVVLITYLTVAKYQQKPLKATEVIVKWESKLAFLKGYGSGLQTSMSMAPFPVAPT